MKFNSAVLVVNNKARSGGLLNTDQCVAQLQAGGIEVTVFNPADGDDNKRLEALLDKDKAPLLIVAGGDGSVNFNLNWAIQKDLVLAVIPVGTANDFARNLGIPADPIKACELIVAGAVTGVDVCKVNNSYFVNVAHIGLGVQVSRELSPEQKQRWGVFSYLRAFLRVLNRVNTFKAKLVMDGMEKSYRLLHLSIGCGRFYGGGNIVEESCFANNGWLNISGLRKRSFFRFIFSLPFVRLGKHKLIKEGIVAKAKKVAVITRRPKSIHADGEPIGQTPAEFELISGVLKVVYNPDNHFLEDK